MRFPGRRRFSVRQSCCTRGHDKRDGVYHWFSKPTLSSFQIKKMLTVDVVFIACGNPKYEIKTESPLKIEQKKFHPDEGVTSC